MLQKTNAEWVEVLSEMGIPVGPVQDIGEVARDPQVNERDMFVELDHPALGPVRFTGNPMKLSRTPSGPKRVPPDLGEHSIELLNEILGMDEAQASELLSDGVVA